MTPTKDDRVMNRPAGAFLAVGLLAAVYVLLWILLPSANIHPDALDELRAVESPAVPLVGKHPAAEPAVWGLVRLVGFVGELDRTTRLTQIWNALWMTAALGAMTAFLWRSRRSGVVVLGWTLIAASCYASMHFALDPYLFYWPPALAGMSWGLLLAARGPRRFAPVVALLTVSGLFNPMCAVALPLAATLWLMHSNRGSLECAQALGLIVIPSAVLLVAMASAGDIRSVVDGPWGTWTSSTMVMSAKGLAGALLPEHEGYRLLGLLQPRLEAPFVVGATVVALLAAVLVLEALRIVGTPAVLRRFAPWTLTASLSGLMIAWWDPIQRMFWILPVWIGILGLLDADDGERESPPLNPARRAAVVTLGLVLAAANLGWYAWPAATRLNDQRLAAEKIGRHFTAKDLIVTWTYQDLYLDYYGGVPTKGLLGLYLSRAEGESTFDRLRQIVIRVQRRGGSVYFAVPRTSREWSASYERERVDLDYSERDLDLVDWGATAIVGGREFREIRSVRS